MLKTGPENWTSKNHQMRTYRKVYANADYTQVAPYQTDLNTIKIALSVPHTKAQIITAYNILGAFYAGPAGFFGPKWKLYDNANNLYLTYTGAQLASTIFSSVPYEFHPEN